MIYCKKCGVELPENANFCPLCGEPVKTENINEKENINDTHLEEFQNLPAHQRLNILWQIVTFILFFGVVITTIVNLLVNHAITWSKYTTSIAVLLFINVSIFIFLNKKILLKHIFSFITLSGFILLLDVFNKSFESAVKYVIPIIFIGYIVVWGFFFIVRKIKKEVFKLIAYSLITLGFVNIIIDAIIEVYVKSKLNVSWSLIVFVSTFFVALLLLYLNRRLKKVTDLKRFFHL